MDNANMTDESKSLDILGIKPVSDAIKTVTETSVKGAASFLSRICMPAATEIGLLLQDNVREWRKSNVVSIAQKAEQKLIESDAAPDVHAPPRLIFNILEEGSWIEDSVVQDLWAGLLSSSCTESGDDDSNLLFVNILSNLTKLQVRLLKYACETAQKSVTDNGLIVSQTLMVELDTLTDVAIETDIQRLDRELDHLRECGLIIGGFQTYSSDTDANLQPTALALHMYVRCQGVRTSPIDFFNLEIPQPPTTKDEQTAD